MSVTATDLLSIPDEEALLQRLWRELSPDGHTAHCPKCEGRRIFKRYQMTPPRRSWTCTACGHHLHPTAGTPFEKVSFDSARWAAERAFSTAPRVPNQCSGHVKLGNGVFAQRYPEVRCSRRGSLEHEGRWYCRTHAPTIPVATEDVYEDAIKLCGCGCGETVNPWLAVFRTWVDDGATHAEVAELLGFSRSYVSRLLKQPPTFVKGHSSRTYWVSPEGQQRKAAWAKRVTEGRLAAASRKEDRRLRAQDKPLLGTHWLGGNQRVSIVSLEEPVASASNTSMCGGELTRHDLVSDPTSDPERAYDEVRFWNLVGNMRPEDVAKMDSHSLERLQQKLRDEGLVTIGVQKAERERLRDPHAHTGAHYRGQKSIPGGKTKRREKLGRHSTPAQKPRKRWTRDA